MDVDQLFINIKTFIIYRFKLKDLKLYNNLLNSSLNNK